jgi:uncharacterized lipoprotein YmbA
VKRNRLAFLLLLAASLSLCGCASGPQARYYTLLAVHPPVEETDTLRKGEAGVAIGPVTLPDYVDRPEIVTRSAGGEVEIANLDRWAGPLEDEVTRVLVEDVGAFLRQRGMTAVSWRQQGAGRASVPITIVRLDAVPGRDVQINAQWRVRGIGPTGDTRFFQETFRAVVAGPDYRSTVQAMSQAVGQLSARIAQTTVQALGK